MPLHERLRSPLGPPVGVAHRPYLIGREEELEALERTIALAREGTGGVLVLDGEPGIGKTALLRAAERRADGLQLCRVAGVRGEMDFEFAGLHQLCLPLLGHERALPEPQRTALRAAFGIEGPPPQRLLVGLALLGMLSTASAVAPLVCLIDDAQWLDRSSSQALAFAARRLEGEAVALLFARRAGSADTEFDELPRLRVGGLTDGASRSLLEAAGLAPPGAALSDRLVDAAGGSPLALLTLRPQTLAASTDQSGPDHQAWLGAESVASWDESVAADLERNAAHAARRAGAAEAATFLERAVEVSPDPLDRGRRAVEAAEAKLHAAAYQHVDRLIAVALMSPLDPVQQAHADRLLTLSAFARDPDGDAPARLVDIARRLESDEPAAARDTYREALATALVAGPVDPAASLSATATHAAGAPPATHPRAASELLFDGLVARWTRGRAAAAPLLAEARTAYSEGTHVDSRDLVWEWQLCLVAADDLDGETWRRAAVRSVEVARARGLHTILPLSLNLLAVNALHRGRPDESTRLADEAAALAARSGQAELLDASILRAAWQGDAVRTELLATAALRRAVHLGSGRMSAVVQYARALLLNALGDHAGALEHTRAVAEQDHFAISPWALIELVEAASLCGEQEAAKQACVRLTDLFQTSDAGWAQGAVALTSACVEDGPAAERAYRSAIEQLQASEGILLLLRARLSYGQWLRARGRRPAAGRELTGARDLARSVGAHAFADRADRALRATTPTSRPRRAARNQHLTPQEARIARLASSGLTNTAIGEELRISGRTVEWHLRKVFSTLGIQSRQELPAAFAAAGVDRSQKGST